MSDFIGTMTTEDTHQPQTKLFAFAQILSSLDEQEKAMEAELDRIRKLKGVVWEAHRQELESRTGALEQQFRQ